MNHESAIKSWSDFPVDIQSVIMEHLYFDDQIRFRAVCKSWQCNTYAIKSADQLPWLFTYDYNQDDKVSGFCYLYNPSNKTKYEIKKKLPFGSRFHDSKYGWILISKVNKNVHCYSAHRLLFVFYNPFTDETIKLPVPERPLDIHDSWLIFSGNPTSKECVIFGHGISIELYTCRPGDTRWTRHYCLEYFGRDILSLACVDGVLYCAYSASRFGGEKIWLSSFKIIAKQQKIVFDPIDVLSFAIPSRAIYRCKLIESDGNLLLTYPEDDDDSCVVFRVDFSEKKLVEFGNLEKKMLCKGSGKYTLVPLMEAAIELANTVHHNCFIKFDSHFYKAPKTHFCTPQPYDWIKKPEKSEYESNWIQPPLHVTRFQKNHYSC